MESQAAASTVSGCDAARKNQRTFQTLHRRQRKRLRHARRTLQPIPLRAERRIAGHNIVRCAQLDLLHLVLILVALLFRLPSRRVDFLADEFERASKGAPAFPRMTQPVRHTL